MQTESLLKKQNERIHFVETLLQSLEIDLHLHYQPPWKLEKNFS